MKRGFVDTPHGQMHYRTEGSGEPVLLFHPTPLSSLSMAPLISALGKSAWAIGVDTMGYGDSDRPPTPYTTMHEFAQSIAWFCEGLGLKQVNIAATLTGAQMALQVAADFPDLVKALVVQEAFNWNTPSRRAVHQRIHRYHERREDGSHIIELWDRMAYTTDLKEREVMFMNLFRVNDDEGAEAYEGMGWEGAGPYAMTRQEMWDDVAPRVKCPTLLTYRKGSELSGAYDRFMKTLPHAKGLKDAPNFFRDPEEFAALVMDFIKNPVVA